MSALSNFDRTAALAVQEVADHMRLCRRSPGEQTYSEAELVALLHYVILRAEGRVQPNIVHVHTNEVQALKGFRDAAVVEFRAIQSIATDLSKFAAALAAGGGGYGEAFGPALVRIREATERGMRGGFQ